jgi:serine/threonine protein kinase, bacterial
MWARVRGGSTTTVVTNECGNEGAVVDNPVVATRTTDVPSGVDVADPASFADTPTTSSPAPPSAGPVLQGTYRLVYDDADQTVNGTPITGDAKQETHLSASRSSRTSTRCVATGTGLADNNHHESSGAAEVLQFTDGSWRDIPYLQESRRCDTSFSGANLVTRGEAADRSTVGLSLKPRSDRTLQGFSTITVITDGCGALGCGLQDIHRNDAGR